MVLGHRLWFCPWWPGMLLGVGNVMREHDGSGFVDLFGNDHDADFAGK